MKEFIAGLPGWLRTLVLGAVSAGLVVATSYAENLTGPEAALATAVVAYVAAWLTPLNQGVGLFRVARDQVGGLK